MKFTSLAAVLLSCAAAARAQVTGTVLEPDGAPAFYANVVLAKASDTSYVADSAAGPLRPIASFTDEDGAFRLEVPDAPAADEYRLRVTSIGLPDVTTGSFGVSPDGTYDAGVITFGEGTTELTTATVTARRQLISRQIDRTVVDVASDPTALGQTALEVLERAPGVFLDRSSGTLQMLGKSGVQVMINGRLNYMPADALLAFLRRRLG